MQQILRRVVPRVESGPGHGAGLVAGDFPLGGRQFPGGSEGVAGLPHFRGEEFFQPLALVFIIRMADEVFGLLWVVLQIKQQLIATGSRPKVFEGAVEHAGHGSHDSAHRADEEKEPVAPLRSCGLIEKTHAVAAFRDRGPAKVAEGRQEVRHAGDGSAVRAPQRSVVVGRTPEEGHVGAGFEEDRLGAHVMVAEHFAVIAGENDVGVVEQVQLAQPGEEFAELIINVCDERVIGASGSKDLLFVPRVAAVECPRRPHETGWEFVRIA